MQAKNNFESLCRKTFNDYRRFIRNIENYYKKSLLEIADVEIVSFAKSLNSKNATKKTISACNLYFRSLGIDKQISQGKRTRRRKLKLQVSHENIVMLINSCSIEQSILFSLVYYCGIEIEDVVRLKASEIEIVSDSTIKINCQLFIVPLVLVKNIKLHCKDGWLFKCGKGHITVDVAEKMLFDKLELMNMESISFKKLNSSFNMHLLKSLKYACDKLEIEELLG